MGRSVPKAWPTGALSSLSLLDGLFATTIARWFQLQASNFSLDPSTDTQLLLYPPSSQEALTLTASSCPRVSIVYSINFPLLSPSHILFTLFSSLIMTSSNKASSNKSRRKSQRGFPRGPTSSHGFFSTRRGVQAMLPPVSDMSPTPSRFPGLSLL